MTPSATLQALRAQRLINELDMHFAELVCRLSDTGQGELALAAALTSNATGNGHLCLELERVAGQPLGAPEICRAPQIGEWERLLRASSLVGTPGEFRPLVLDRLGRLYLYRYWRYQQHIAEELLQRASRSVEDVDAPLLARGLERLFPTSDPDYLDWQKIAAACALLRNFTVISGGPGTGKTNTVVRLLALLLEQARTTEVRIALAAPTGKASARLEESIHQARRQLPMDDALWQRLPERATTIHRLLGSRPGSVYFRHDRDNPIPVDVLVVDEASMVDVALLSKLLEALPQRSRLILLGDRQQLASVEAGAVLGDICAGVAGFSAAFAERLSGVLGKPPPCAAEPVTPLSDSVVLLRRSYRFGPDSGIGLAAQALASGDADACVAVLDRPQLPDVQRLDARQDPLSEAVDGYRLYLEAVRHQAAPEEVFKAFGEFRVLTALRTGPRGSEALNPAIEQALSEAGLLDARRRWYPGRPVLIRRNDYGLRLYNGDIGILLRDEEGEYLVHFPGPEGSVRRFAPSRIPVHDTAFAMTVHKSQGSEFDRVLMVMPQQDAPLLTRELIYTALTRARSGFRISASREIIQVAASRELSRSSGLKDALWGNG